MAFVAIIDYGMGNLHSASKAFERLGAKVAITQEKQVLQEATHVVLPGVGAFPDAIARLKETGLDQVAVEFAHSGKPFLGICLGMQMMMSDSTEGGFHEGLGIFPGGITLMDAGQEKIPHMGWNEVHDQNNCPLLHGISGKDFYFVHSFCAQEVDVPWAAGITEYGRPFSSIIWDGRSCFGVQFHPEKSGEAGRRLLSNFLELK